MPGEIDIDTTEGRIYSTLKENIPVVKEVVGTGVAIVKLLYGIGDTDKLDQAVARLEREQQKLRAMIANVQGQINEIATGLTKAKNLQRMDDIDEQLVELMVLLVKLKNPQNSAHDFHEIASEAHLRANKLLKLEKWLWSDTYTVPVSTDDAGNEIPEEVRPLPDRFVTTFALPAYSLALAVFSVAAVCNLNKLNLSNVQARRQAMTASYREALETHINATSLPYRWEDDNNPADLEAGQTLQERVRKRIVCSVVAATKFARNGVCHFDIYSHDMLAGVRKLRRAVELPHPANALCTYPGQLTWGDEMEAEAESADLQLLQLWFDTLSHLQSTGLFPAGTQFIGRFPDWTAARANIYFAAKDGTLTATRQLWPRDVSSMDEQLVVGSGWNGGKPIPGGGSVIYLGYPDGSWFWYRHTGGEAPRLAATWMPRKQVIAAPNGKPWFRNRRVFGGGDGVLYGIVQNDEIRRVGNGEIVRFPRRGELMWIRHAGYYNGAGGFTAETRIGVGWHETRHVFSMGEGIIYAIMLDGTLRWYKHKGYLTGKDEWEPWKAVGNGWNMFADVFPAGEGLIYAREASGRTYCYRHKAWRTGGDSFDRRVELIDLIPDQHAMFAALPGADFGPIVR